MLQAGGQAGRRQEGERRRAQRRADAPRAGRAREPAPDRAALHGRLRRAHGLARGEAPHPRLRRRTRHPLRAQRGEPEQVAELVRELQDGRARGAPRPAAAGRGGPGGRPRGAAARALDGVAAAARARPLRRRGPGAAHGRGARRRGSRPAASGATSRRSWTSTRTRRTRSSATARSETTPTSSAGWARRSSRACRTAASPPARSTSRATATPTWTRTWRCRWSSTRARAWRTSSCGRSGRRSRRGWRPS